MAHRKLRNDRRSFLCTYDVASDKPGDKRRSQLFDLLIDHDEHVQFSVFLCVLTKAEITTLRAEAEEILHRERSSAPRFPATPRAL